MTNTAPAVQVNADLPVTDGFVREAYRVLLGREPESEDVVRHNVQLGIRRSDLVTRILKSIEFSLSPTAALLQKEHWDLDYGHRALSADQICGQFARVGLQGEPGFYKDFLGVRTRCTYVPGLQPQSGIVFGLPSQGQAIPFDPGEWEGTLRSVLEARKRVVAFELGAGWGPWLVTTAAAARIRGVKDVSLVGVEADAGHYEMLLTHFADNGIDAGDHTLLKGIVGVEDGFALFPKLPDSNFDWGAQAVLDDKLQIDGNFQDYRGRAFDEVERMACVALTTLLRKFNRVDIVHCDIQGSEVQVIPAAFDEIDKRVRRFVLGTHSREAEAVALAHFSKAGWALELETPVKFWVADGRVVPHEDGLQVWSNPKLA